MNIIPLKAVNKLIKAVDQNHKFDLSRFELISLRFRVAKLLNQYQLSDTDMLIMRLDKDRHFFEDLLYHILIEPTSMFRDPEFWILLRDRLLPLLSGSSRMRAWLPQVSSGEELFSLAIVLQDTRFIRNVSILVTGICSVYLKYCGLLEFNEYFTKRNQDIYFNRSLMPEVRYKKQDISYSAPLLGYKESIKEGELSESFSVYDSTESIYVKKENG